MTLDLHKFRTLEIPSLEQLWGSYNRGQKLM